MNALGVLTVVAHPDDESLLVGGTLAACTAFGIPAAILTVTRGEAGPISDTRLASRKTLGIVREAELRGAAEALGVSTVECLDYPDGQLQSIDWDAVAATLELRIRQLQPAMVITFGEDGLYWHPDHTAVHYCTLAALDALAVEGVSPHVYFASWPDDLAVRLTRALADRRLGSDLWGLSPHAFGVPLASIRVVVDVRPFVRCKLAALRSHRTQISDGNLFNLIPDDLAERFLGREYFVHGRSGSGPDWLRVLGGAAAGPQNGWRM